MSELDELLARERARRRGAVPEVPGFDGLRERGLRLRRRRRVAAAGGAALVVVGVLALGQLVGGPIGGDAQPVAPTPSATRAATPSPTPTPTSVPRPSGTAVPPAPAPTTPDETVDHPAARLVELVVSPRDPDARVAVWSYCQEGCKDPTYVLAVTGDGFATRTALESPGKSIDEAVPVVTPLTEDAFAVASADGAFAVLRTAGSSTPVRSDQAIGPLVVGEVLVPGPPDAPGSYMGLDPGTARAHPVTVPRDAHTVVAQPDGTLHGLTWTESGSSAVWSTDGGETWSEQRLATSGSAMLVALPSAKKGTLAVLEGADGATLFPLIRVHRYDGGAWQSFDLGSDPRAYGQIGGVLPDGRLVVEVEGWSDDRKGRPGKNPNGLYVSDRKDWSRLSPVPGGEAPAVPNGVLPRGRNVSSAAAFGGTGASLVLTAVLGNEGEGELSTDGGRTWERVAAR